MILGIYGSGGAGRTLLELAKCINNHSHHWNNFLFINDIDASKKIHNVTQITFEDILKHYSPDEIEIVISLGEPSYRKQLWDKVKKHNYATPSLIHPAVHIPESSLVKSGCTIYDGAFISCDICIDENVTIGDKVSLGHDSKIEKHSVISALSALGGYCTIGESTYVGLNSTIRDRVTIGSNTIIGMGSVVVSDIPSDSVAYGNPSRVIESAISKKVFK